MARECPAPKKRHLEPIAQQIVTQYPVAFKDTICGQMIGKGYDSLLKSLTEKAQNERRGTKNERRGTTTTKSKAADKDEDTPKKRPTTDKYGCVSDKYDPDLPSEERKKQLKLKEEMKLTFKGGVSGDNKEEALIDKIKETYELQRKDILDQQQTVHELQNEWPYLFEEFGMSAHFEELVGLNMRETLEESYETKGKQILDFLKDNAKKAMLSTLTSIAEAKGKLGNDTPDVPGLLMMVMDYFSDEPEEMFLVVEVSFKDL